jgi:hypothetical protein
MLKWLVNGEFEVATSSCKTRTMFEQQNLIHKIHSATEITYNICDDNTNSSCKAYYSEAEGNSERTSQNKSK